MAMTPEGKIKKKLDKMLRGKPRLWSFPPQSGPFGSSGIPDRIACVDGYLLGIEVKSSGSKRPTPLQQQCMHKIETAGGACFVVYDDVTIEIVEDWINDILRNATCGAAQLSDQMVCACGLVWDVNDPEPPLCPIGAHNASS